MIDNGYTSDLIALINYTLVIIRNGKQKQLENICYILHTVLDHDLPADVIKYILRVIELLWNKIYCKYYDCIFWRMLFFLGFTNNIVS